MDNHPGAKLKQRLNEFMGEIIKEAADVAPNEFVYKRFRKKVLDGGNQMIRDFNEELSQFEVHYKVRAKELRSNDE
jgi:hypothetical protein